MSGLKIFLFGPPRIELDGSEVDIKRRKAVAMLAYLAVTGQPHSRDALATLFYPDHSQSRARAYLRRDLAILNTSLAGAWLDTDRETAELKRDYWTDIGRFRAVVAECRQHDHPSEVICAECVLLLQEAATLYTNDFLAGFTLNDCPEFDDWQFFEAESLRQELAKALERLVQGCREQMQPETAIPYARRWVALDPLHEPAQRALIQMYDQAGQTSAALRQYEEYVDVLEEELGLPPAEETTTLYEAIKAKRMLSGYVKIEESRPTPAPRPERALVAQQTPPPSPAPPEARAVTPTGSGETPHLVGREQELQELQSRLAKAMAGARQIVFVTGEAGAGKTTLIEAFIEQARRQKAILWVGRGQCIEHRGAGEAYMPVLEALGRMCREPGGQTLVTLLARLAPTWLVQMPWLVTAEELAQLQQKVLAATRERMLREMVEAVEILTAEWPVVLVLEDLHWSDYSTLDLLARLAQRQESARLLVIGTYRPADVRLADHPLRAVVEEMEIREQSSELALAYLTEAAIATYLAERFPENEFSETLASLLYRRTGGNPLFLRTVVDFWVAQEVVTRVNDQWRPAEAFETLAGGVPKQLRPLVEQQLRRLPPEDQQILEAASVVGITFSAASVAATIEMVEETIEKRCALLARRGLFLQSSGVVEWPDGTVAERFQFIHHLYQEVLYDRVSAGRRVRLHRQIGERLESGYGSTAPEMAAELALHFVRGRNTRRAVHYLWLAAEHALQRNAHREAIEHLRKGLEILGQEPDGADQAEYELKLQAALGPALIAIQGWSGPEVEAAYYRAYELAQQLGDSRQLSSSLYRVATMHELRGEYLKTQALLEERLQLSAVHEEGALLESHELLACSTFHQGVFDRSLDHANQGASLYDAQAHLELIAFLAENPGVACHHWAALDSWFLGYPDQALTRMKQALALADDLRHAFSQAQANERAAMLHQLRGEAPLAQARAEQTISVAEERGFVYWRGAGKVLRGWALAAQGQAAEGLSQLREGLEICQPTGATLESPYFLALLAEAYRHSGRFDEGLAALAEALALVENSRTFFYEAELHRLKGVMLLRANGGDLQAAEASLQRALDLARAQQAKSLELRAVVSLSRLWQAQGGAAKIESARRLLSEVYNWFTEGFGTADLQEARTLLEELGGLDSPPAPGHPPASMAGAPAATPPSALKQQIHYCRTSDGVRLAYATVGSGPPLVKAANWLSHLEYDWQSPVWRHWLEGLAQHHTLIRYDERGCGLSDWEVADFSLEAWVRDLETVVDAAGLERFPLLGISQGVAIAIAYAVRHPEKVSRLILYGGYARGRLKRDLSPQQIEETQTFLQLIKLGWGEENPAFRQVFTTLFMPDATLEQQRDFNELQRISTSPENAIRLVNSFDTLDIQALAPKIETPALILHARQDARIPFSEAELIANLIPNAQLVPVESKNHILLGHEPAFQQFLEELHRFLQVERIKRETNDESPVSAGNPPLSGKEALPHAELPAQPTPFIGRQKELAEIRRLLVDEPDCRLLTLVGPGGIGKTRLSVEAASQALPGFADGVYFVPLAPLDSAEEMISSLAEALHFKFYEGDAPTTQLVEYLQNKQMLLLMDNFEHLLAGAELVVEILENAPRIKILVTSRERLNFRGETVFTVGSMEIPSAGSQGDTLEFDAAKLFLQQARLLRPGFEPQTEDRAGIKQLCRLTQGMPLALVLAAGWLNMLPVTEIVTELSQNLDILETEMGDVPERQRSLRAVFDSSWQRLSEPEQQALMKLSVFRGGFTRQAVHSVTGATLPVLRRLVNKSFLSANQENRYEIHELLRQYGQEKLNSLDEVRLTTHRRHSSYYLDFLHRRQTGIIGPAQIAILKEIEADLENIRAAWGWAINEGDFEAIAASLEPLFRFYWIHSQFQEGERIFGAAAAQLSKHPQRDEPSLKEISLKLSARQGAFQNALGSVQQAEGQLQHCIEMARVLENKKEGAFSLNILGEVMRAQGHYQAAINHFEESLELGREINDLLSIAHSLKGLGWVSGEEGSDYAKAREYYQEALTHYRAVNHLAAIAFCLDKLAYSAWQLGDYVESEQLFQESLASFKASGDQLGMAKALGGLALVYHSFGGDRLEQARSFAEESLSICRETGHRLELTNRLVILGRVLLRMGRYKQADQQFQEAYQVAGTINYSVGITLALNGLGAVAIAHKAFQQAKKHLLEALNQAANLERSQDMADVILDYAALLIKEAAAAKDADAAKEEQLRAFVILDQVINHRGAWQDTKERATLLIAELERILPPESIALGQTKSKETTLEQIASEILQTDSDNGPPPAESASRPSQPRFLQQALIAAGGMGQVYLGRDTRTGQPVAIKRLRPELLTSNIEAVKRFQREAEALRRLDHPNIVKILDSYQRDGQPVIVMEYIAGGTLQDWLVKAPQMPVERVLSIGLELADALARVHHLGILHRDIKPGNVLLTEDGAPRLTDFGVAYLAQQDVQLTREGAILGTTVYLSPEAWRGEPLDVRSDIWSFGAMLFEMLAGQAPFAAETPVAIMTATLTNPLPSLSRFRSDIPQELVSLIEQMLVKERKQRLNSMRQAAAMLETIKSG